MQRAIRFRTTAIVGIGLGAVACGGDVTEVDPPGARPDTAVIRLRMDAGDLAASLGWTSGIPDAVVYLRRDEDPSIRSFRSDRNGDVRIPDLPGATYWIWAERVLNAEERARAGNTVHVFGGGTTRSLSADTKLTLPLQPDDPGTLVISEYHYHYPSVAYAGLPTYGGHMYIELYNNSDATIYLDGMIVGSAFNYNVDAPLWTCAETQPFREEPRGVYAQFLQRFPGDGAQYPVAPGQTVVIADQAIDHSTVLSELPDLTMADFEFPFGGRANNPSIPDLNDVGLKPIDGHRMERFFGNFDVPFIATPLDVDALERVLPKYQGEFALVPAEAIVDLAAMTSTFYLTRRNAPLCLTQVHPSLDQVSGVLGPHEQPDAHMLSVSRKRLVDGRLQRTRATYVDFEVVARSPGSVP